MSWYYTSCVCGFKDPDFEKPMSINFPLKCPSCKKKTLVQDYSIPKDTIYSDLTPKCIGQQVERNKKAMGQEQCQLKEESMLTEHDKKKAKAKKPWYWNKDQKKPLDVSTIKNIGDYIEHGVKD